MRQNAQVNQKIFLLNIQYFNLVTAPMEVRASTPKLVHVAQVSAPIETKPISTVAVPPSTATIVDASAEQVLTHLTATDDHVEIIKAAYEDKIAKMHENYQYIILDFLFFCDKSWYI
jgi:hypothetical protein